MAMAINVMAIARVSLQRVSRGGVRGCICTLHFHLLQKATSNLITRLEWPGSNKIAIQRGQELRMPHGYMQNHELRVVDAELSVRNEHAPNATTLHHGHLISNSVACYSKCRTCICSGRLAIPHLTTHNCGSSADIRSRTHHTNYFRDIIQPAKISWLYQPELCRDKKLKPASLEDSVT